MSVVGSSSRGINMSRQKIDQQKRRFLAGSAGLTAASVVGLAGSNQALANQSSIGGASAAVTMRRVKPGELGWPSTDKWQALADSMQGKLFERTGPLCSMQCGASCL